MDTESFFSSTEFFAGVGLILAGVLARLAGMQDIFSEALMPFGFGLMLSECASRVAKANRQREKARVRRDD